ncbi:hypothetical protein BOX15_Mlig021414g1 [Macrostomum lignano]|uniref:Uncharacterized protein n=1 Tax=Macrostomum lignano TaxID=282301 RepID=A0A267DN30_9PLAT|nr:hypothetical protein BOX15_Mlig021414g2 [Macrostomum lignano]PAA50586.1 hypothetical protein BOX15_Mlig021414g1 [Macrostomum lignano]
MDLFRGWLFGSPRDRAAAELMATFVSALEENNTSAVRMILQAGMVDPNIKFRARNGKTPLHITCGYNHLACTKLLLEHGANPAMRDNRGKSALMRAVSHGSPEIVRELLLADPTLLTDENEFTDFEGVSLIHYALYGAVASRAVRDANEIMKIVLAYGAAKEVCKAVQSVWILASIDLQEVVAGSLGAMNKKPPPIIYKTASDYVIQHCLINKTALGRIDLLDAAVKNCGINLNFVFDCHPGGINLPTASIPSGLCGAKDGLLSLTLPVAAILCENPDATEAILRYLKAAGATLDHRDRHGFTPTFWAAALGKLSALRYLLIEGKCSASVKSHSDLTLAHLCCAHCPDEATACAVLQLIARRGGPLDRTDKTGRTPSQLLAERSCLNVLRCLAGHRGCKAQQILPLPSLGDSGVSLLGLAVQRGWEAEVLARLCYQRREDWHRQRHHREQQHQQLLEFAVEAGHRRILEALIVFSFDFCSDEFIEGLPRRLLSMAVPQFNVKLLNLLTDRLGVDIDAIDPADGETWLTRATTGGHLGLVQFLLSAGASPDKRNAAGDSAETLAARDIKDELQFVQFMELFYSATPELWPASASSSPSAGVINASVELRTRERQVTLQLAMFTQSYLVVEYSVYFSQAVNIFRMSRRDQLPVLSDILSDIRQRVLAQRRLSMRALVAIDVKQQVSADWPVIEYAAGLTTAKLRELLCQLHHLVSPNGDQTINGFELLVTAYI